MWPSPRTMYFREVRPLRPTGPRAWSLPVEMPISAPNPYSKPSAKRVEALCMTEPESEPEEADPMGICSTGPEALARKLGNFAFFMLAVIFLLLGLAFEFLSSLFGVMNQSLTWIEKKMRDVGRQCLASGGYDSASVHRACVFGFTKDQRELPWKATSLATHRQVTFLSLIHI